MSPLVIDASAAMGFLLDDEKAAPSLKALTAIERGTLAYVPNHWWLETANALLMAERRLRVSLATVTESLCALQSLPVIRDDETAQPCGRETLALARQYSLDLLRCGLSGTRYSIQIDLGHPRSSFGLGSKKGGRFHFGIAMAVCAAIFRKSR